MPRADLGARPYIGSAMITVAERRKPTVYLRPGLQQLSTRCRTPGMGPDGRSLSRVVRTHCGAAPASRELLYTGSIKTSFLKSGPQQRYCNFGALCRKYALILHCPLCHRLALAQSDLMRVARPSLDSPCPLGVFPDTQRAATDLQQLVAVRYALKPSCLQLWAGPPPCFAQRVPTTGCVFPLRHVPARPQSTCRLRHAFDLEVLGGNRGVEPSLVLQERLASSRGDCVQRKLEQ